VLGAKRLLLQSTESPPTLPFLLVDAAAVTRTVWLLERELHWNCGALAAPRICSAIVRTKRPVHSFSNYYTVSAFTCYPRHAGLP
jgi:hypothetical protein